MAKTVAIIVTGDTLERVYSAMIFGMTAASMNMKTHIFFSFFGINAIKKNADLKMGSDYKSYEKMLPQRFKEMNIPPVQEMIKQAKSMGAKIYACKTTMAAFGLKMSDFIEVVDKEVGAAEFLEITTNANTTMTF
jgi:peroxiredoxin family protein